MAQCRAEERKHHSAMDMYVGILHSKLHNPSMEAEKYQHWSSYGSSAQNFRKEPTSTNKNSHYSGSFREDPDLKPEAHAMKQDGTSVQEARGSARNGRYGSINAIKSSLSDEELSEPIHTKKYSESAKSAMDPMESPDKVRNCMDFNNEKLCDSRDYPQSQKKSVDLASSSGSIFRAHDSVDHANHSMALNSEKLYDSRGFPHAINTGKVKKALASDPHASNDPNTKGSSTMEAPNQKKPEDVATSNGPSLRSHDSPRTHKSAEQTVVTSGRANSGSFGNSTRLYKSGEQMNANVNNEESNQGGLIVGADSSSPTTNVKEGGRRWSSTGSVDCPPIFMGLSSNAKDGDRRASFNGGLSVSDGGSPIAKDSWRRSSTGGYGSADSSCLGGPGLYTNKDLGSRSNILNNNKDSSSNVSLRGMGNILGGGNMNGNLGKPKASSASKPGCIDKVESCVVKKSDDVTFPSSHPINSNLGNICAGGRWNPSVPTGNILNHGSLSRSSNRMAEEPKHGVCQMDDPEEIKNAGNELYKKGNFSEAVAFYDRSIAMCPNHAPYRSNRAAALIGLSRLGEAVQECEEAIRLDPRYARAHHRAAYLYVRLGLIESAKRHLAVTCQADAKEMQNLQIVERHISKCIEARKMGNWRSILSESNAAIAAGADSAPQILGYKSEALLKLHKQEEAEVVCTEALKLEASLCKLGVVPADSFLHMLRAHIEMSLGRFDDAVHAAESAVKLDPRNPEAVGLLRKAHAVCQTRRVGNKLFNAGKFFEACAAYGEGLESDPTNAVLLCNRAACRSKIGQWEKAIEDCNAALNAQPNYIKALMRRANCSSKVRFGQKCIVCEGKKERYINVYQRPKLSYETNHNSKFGGLSVICTAKKKL